jgi:hypothetical protein
VQASLSKPARQGCVVRRCPTLRHNSSKTAHATSALPNPSLKRSTNGRPPGPRSRYGVHCLLRGPGVLPLAPA